MKKYWIPAIVLAVLAAASVLISPSLAQEKTPAAAPQAKIAVCDVAAIFKEYQKSKDLTREDEEKRIALEEENNTRTKAIQKLENRLTKLNADSKEYDDCLNEMTKLSLDRKSWSDLQGELLLRTTYRRTEDLYKEILAMVKTIAREKGLDLVLFKEGEDTKARNLNEMLQTMSTRKVLYSSANVEITEEILTRLNERYSGAKKD